MIWIAGVNVKRDVVPELADRLVHADHREVAAKLLKASADGETEISLSIDERDAILAVLGDHPKSSKSSTACCRPSGSGAAEHDTEAGRKADGTAEAEAPCC